jgi:hypothetical protein
MIFLCHHSIFLFDRQYELDAFIDQGRKKFLGYGDLDNDNETLIGLPYPIHESVRILKQVNEMCS